MRRTLLSTLPSTGYSTSKASASRPRCCSFAHASTFAWASLTRTLERNLVNGICQNFDAAVLNAVKELLHIHQGECGPEQVSILRRPLRLGGLGLTAIRHIARETHLSAVLTTICADWNNQPLSPELPTLRAAAAEWQSILVEMRHQPVLRDKLLRRAGSHHPRNSASTTMQSRRRAVRFRTPLLTPQTPRQPCIADSSKGPSDSRAKWTTTRRSLRSSKPTPSKHPWQSSAEDLTVHDSNDNWSHGPRIQFGISRHLENARFASCMQQSFGTVASSEAKFHGASEDTGTPACQRTHWRLVMHTAYVQAARTVAYTDPTANSLPASSPHQWPPHSLTQK